MKGTTKPHHAARYGLSRPTSLRAPLPVIVVVCDDSKTAVAYFTELKREVKAHLTVRVVPAPCDGANPADILSLAKSHADDLRNGVDHDGEANDSVWALIDREGEPDRQAQADQARQSAAANKVKVLLSNPCYEVWTLAHLVDTGEALNNCQAVLARVKLEWKTTFRTPFPKSKANADYTKLTPFRVEALRRAKQHHKNGDQSWTEVYMVVEAIMSGASAS